MAGRRTEMSVTSGKIMSSRSSLKLAPVSALRMFLRQEAAGGFLLVLAAAAAIVVANSSLGEAYGHALHMRLGPMSVSHWINDGLMTLFFFVVGLEIKRELVDGRLSNWSDRALPFVAALGGMAAPAAIYLALAGRTPGLSAGWAVPTATDIAFAMGVMAMLGSRVPTALKLFLTTVAIVDDMGAVVIIALAYTSGINSLALLAAGAAMAAMVILNRAGVKALWPYLALFAALWLAVLQSGIHATIAGVLAASVIPIRATPAAPDAADSPLHRLEHALHPWVAFAIVPIFAFANAGVSLTGLSLADLLRPLPLGVAAGLFLGKQCGVLAAVWLCQKLGIAGRPGGASWLQLYGVALLCGIGFTMSLFIGGLAFDAPALVDDVKLGVLCGSLASGLAGFMVLRFAARRRA